jgi:hypothetical protein
MKRRLSFLVVLVLAAAAAGQELKYVPCAPDDAIGARGIGASPTDFDKPGDGAGTVNKNAVVASFSSSNTPLKVAIDSAKADAKGPDLLRLDFSGAGKFDNECVVPFEIRSSGDKSLNAEIGPKTVQAKVDGKTIPVTVKGTYFKSEAARYLNLTVTAGAEASCKFGEKTYKVRLIDGTGNLKFTDAARPLLGNGHPISYQPGDTVLVDSGDGTFAKGVWKGFYGQPVVVDGKAYQLTVSTDGTKVSAEPLTVELGKIKVDQGNWNAILAGKKNVLYVAGGKDPVAVPADEYAVLQYQVTQEGADKATLSGRGAQDKSSYYTPVPVAAGKVTDLAIGAPLKAVVEGLKSGDSIALSLVLTDAGGGRITSLATSAGGQPDPPKVTIVDASGATVHKATLEYG